MSYINQILEYTIDDLSLCDELIDLHEGNSEKEDIDLKCGHCNTPMKSCSQSSFHPLWHRLVPTIGKLGQELVKAGTTFSKMYGEALWPSMSVQMESFNIQHYRPGELYSVWHSEKSPDTIQNSNREGVWMLYLNDAPNAGTEFKFQEVTLQAEKGKMVVWPAFWTHTHRGIVSPTQDKYIATGWFNRER